MSIVKRQITIQSIHEFPKKWSSKKMSVMELLVSKDFNILSLGINAHIALTFSETLLTLMLSSYRYL